MLTPYGIEGGLIYALSNLIRDDLNSSGIKIDLRPNLSLEEVNKRLEKKKDKISLSNHLRKSLGIKKHVFILLKELLSSEDLSDMKKLSYQ